MVDLAFADPSLAQLYDVLNPWRPCDEFYLDLVMRATSVLDVGCGTGTLLRRARQAGHVGRLCGLDPAAAMLNQAREQPDVEWVLGDLTSRSWRAEFDLVVMTGHAFQVLLTDDEIRANLAAVRDALADSGRFAFETRNPLVRPWQRWTPEQAVEVVDAAGETVRVWHQVDHPVDGRLVTFTTTFDSPGRRTPRYSRSTLRFVGRDELSAFLSAAGFAVEAQFGDWDRAPVTDASPEIITVARRT
ncbi:MAG TPA: class I SAM-dependent methyltransferase [Micromonosporaceae bacterium]